MNAIMEIINEMENKRNGKTTKNNVKTNARR